MQNLLWLKNLVYYSSLSFLTLKEGDMDQEKMKFVRSVPFQVANLLPDEKQIYTFAVKLFSNEQESLFGFFGPKQYKLADGVFFLHLTDLRIVLEQRMLTEDEKKSIKIGEKMETIPIVV